MCSEYHKMSIKSLMTIRNKLTSAFIALIILIVIIGAFSLKEISILSKLTVKLYNHPLAVTRSSLQANVNIIKMHRSMKDIVLAQNSAKRETAIQKVNVYEALVYKEYDIITERILGKEGDVLIADTIQIFRDCKSRC